MAPTGCIAAPLALYSRLSVDLNIELQDLGQELVVRVGSAVDILAQLHSDYNIGTLYTHEETGNLWSYRRDIAVQNLCTDLGIRLETSPTNGIVRKLGNRDNWSSIRNKRMAESIHPKPNALKAVERCQSDPLPTKYDPMFGKLPIGQVQKGGRIQAIKDLRSFLSDRSRGYLSHISGPINPNFIAPAYPLTSLLEHCLPERSANRLQNGVHNYLRKKTRVLGAICAPLNHA